MVGVLVHLRFELPHNKIGDDASLHHLQGDCLVQEGDILIGIGRKGAKPGDDVFVIVNRARWHPVQQRVNAVVKPKQLADGQQMRFKIPGL